MHRKAVRDACTAADTMLSEQQIGNSRPDLYRAVLAYSETDEEGAHGREGAISASLGACGRPSINTKLSAMGIEFQKNLGEESSSFLFKASELAAQYYGYTSSRRICSNRASCFSPATKSYRRDPRTGWQQPRRGSALAASECVASRDARRARTRQGPRCDGRGWPWHAAVRWWLASCVRVYMM